MKKIHYVTSAYNTATMCGRSTHGWQGPRTPVTDTDPKNVTCTVCREKMKR